jgi:hypothetical protein
MERKAASRGGRITFGSLLAGFCVLFVVETDVRHSMASDAAAPNVSNAIRSEEKAA